MTKKDKCKVTILRCIDEDEHRSEMIVRECLRNAEALSHTAHSAARELICEGVIRSSVRGRSYSWSR